MSGFPTISFLEIDGKVLSGEEFEEYCKDHGLCRRCAKVRTHRRTLKLFGRGKKWEPMNLHDEETGEYKVYNGYCLQPTCYTIGQAKRLIGEGSSDRRKSSRRQKLKEKIKGVKRRPSKRKPRANPETGSVMSGMDDDYSISSDMSGLSAMSGMSSMSGISQISGMSGFSGVSFRKKKNRRSGSNKSSASSISDDDTINSTTTPAPQTIVAGQPSPIVTHRVEQLVMHDYFTVLDLSKVELREEDIAAVANALGKTKSLESITMDKCKLKDDKLEKIAEGLKNGGHINLKKISLRQNSIGNRGVQSLEFLFRASPTLEEIDLSENGISSKGAALILSSLHENKQTVIHTLNLSQNEIWDMDDGSFIKSNSTLNVLNLDGNFMHDEGAEQISKSIAANRNCKLEKLYLGWNGISDDGATALAKMMEVNATLQVLGLAENDISNTGARAILAALAVNTSVREISGLYHNQIDRKFIIVAIKRLLHRYGERTGEPVSAHPGHESSSTKLNAGEVKTEETADVPVKDRTREEEKVPIDEEDNKLTDSDSSTNWAAQMFPTQQEEEKPVTSVALEAIENWDWGTFGIEEIEAQRSSELQMPDVDIEPETVTVEEVTPKPTDSFPADRVTVFQSAPLAYFDRKTTEHHDIPILDFEYEARSLKEAFADKHAVGADIEIAFENATTDRFSAFFSQGFSRVMHFSSHGHPDCLALENGFGYMQAFSSEDLKASVAKGADHVQVVFISSCHALYIAKAFLNAGVPHVVCCKRDAVFRDEGPVEFAKAFYQALAKNKTLKESFDAGLDFVKRSPLVTNCRNLADRYQLLPKKDDALYHNVNVFFEKPLAKRTEVEKGDTSMLPRLPNQFVGREVDMYEILESLRVDDVIRVGGVPGSGKATVLSAVSRYILDRPKSFQINSVFWLPPPKTVVPEEDSLFGDLCQILEMLMNAEDDLWDEDDFTECRERIMIELEEIKCVLVIDGRLFTTEAAGENLEKFLTHLLNECNVKIILITAIEGAVSPRNKRSRSEETIITIGPVGFKASALLFGDACKHISGTGNPTVHTADEFANFLVPPSVRNLAADQNKELSRRQTELFERMGKGNPRDIVEAASNISEEGLNDLLRFSKRPEVQVSSAGGLEVALNKHTAEKEKAVKGKNFLRAQDLTATLEELQSLKSKYPSLADLMDKESEMKKEFSTLLKDKKYNEANEIKRKILALKKTILKEKLAKPKESGPKYTPSNRLKELEEKMQKMKMEMAEKSKSKNSGANGLQASPKSSFLISRGEEDCMLEILCGSIEAFQYSEGTSGLICWTNESCDLTTYDVGKNILNKGAQNLTEELSALETVVNTNWGAVKCPTGEALIMGPRSFSDLTPRYIVLAVSPLSETSDDSDWDGDGNQDPDSIHYLETGLRASYRSSFRKVNDTGLEAICLSSITTKENGATYEQTLRVGLQTLVEEAKFSGLKYIRLVASSEKEATALVKMAVGLGLSMGN